MASLPSGWSKKKDTKSITIYEDNKHLIYIWKHGRGKYDVECFKKATGYKTRLLSKEFSAIKDATKFARDLMKQRRLKRSY
jgi:hypothetical protein